MSIAFTRLADRGPISLHSAGTFTSGDMRHAGALLISPQGIYDWASASAGFDEAGLFGFLDMNQGLHCDMLLLGTGPKPVLMPADFRAKVERRGLGLEAMGTEAAIRTYNILLAENRRFLAGLLPA